jgi:hypothetical protein
MHPSPHLPCGQGRPMQPLVGLVLVDNSANTCCCCCCCYVGPRHSPRTVQPTTFPLAWHHASSLHHTGCGVWGRHVGHLFGCCSMFRPGCRAPGMHAPSARHASCPRTLTHLSVAGWSTHIVIHGTPAHCAAVLAAGCGRSILQSPPSPTLPACKLKNAGACMPVRASMPVRGSRGPSQVLPHALPSAQGRGGAPRASPLTSHPAQRSGTCLFAGMCVAR